jgi:tetratricopeptide (TPR) repeat protein
MYADWDWNGAESALLQALRIDPNDAFARHGLADLLTIRGRPEEGLRQAKLGRQADPLSSLVNGTVVGHLYLARRFEEAIAELARLRDKFHAQNLLQTFLTSSLWELHRYEDAWRESRTAWSRMNDPRLLQVADRGYAIGGPPNGMRAVADYAATHWDSGNATVIAKIYARGGAPESSLRWLERAYRERISNLPLEVADPVFDGLRPDRRFQTLLREMGLAATPSNEAAAGSVPSAR